VGTASIASAAIDSATAFQRRGAGGGGFAPAGRMGPGPGMYAPSAGFQAPQGQQKRSILLPVYGKGTAKPSASKNMSGAAGRTREFYDLGTYNTGSQSTYGKLKTAPSWSKNKSKEKPDPFFFDLGAE
jgi:hypothetical protein